MARFCPPFSILFFLVTWSFLFMVFRPKKSEWTNLDRNTFKIQLKHLGKRSYEENIILLVFLLLALLWLLRADLNLGAIQLKGWASWFPYGYMIKDGTIAILMAITLFVIPAGKQKGTRILDWKTASALPWHILLLFGGDFALASGMKESGLSLWFGEQLIWVADLHPLWIIVSISFIMTFLTEMTSNTATTEMILPVLAGIAITTQINPVFLMIPATLSASMAFMLPVATPPNAIIFGTSRISIAQMARTGLVLNLVGIAIISLMMYFWGSAVFGSFYSAQ